MMTPEVDVLIVGAGLSGIGAAVHLKTRCPDRSYEIFEARDRLGGTWDLFRYPGVRSDSDMYTLGYAFRPWTDPKAIADGGSILNYVRSTAEDAGVDRRIRYGRRVRRISWCSKAARWTVEADAAGTGEKVRLRCRFIVMCCGYYDYAGGHDPTFEGEGDFEGRIVHAQQWPEGLDFAGKRVVVIGSGATAVTLVPEMAKTAASVVMLQRSPTYVVSRPSTDAFADGLRRRLPAQLAYQIIRWRNVLMGMVFFNFARRRPHKAKTMLLDMVKAQLGPDYDVATHFTPRYNPWDQRICLVPDADLFNALRTGRAEVVTDVVAKFDRTGLELASGRRLEVDLVVKATGLRLKLLDGVEILVDGERRSLSDALTYKGMMFSHVPNLASVFGYTNASWTLKADLTSRYVCRLLNHMARTGFEICTPRPNGEADAGAPWMDFNSGYVLRSMSEFPKQGARKPWRVHHNYALDVFSLKFGRLNDGAMEFSRAQAAKSHDRGRLEIAAE